MISVSDTVFIEGSLQRVYGYCWDARQWPAITSHVKEVRIFEEDDAFQRMAMTVESDGRVFHTESVRRTAPLEWIRYDQLTPPPFLLSHIGEWRFSSEDDGTRVVLTHQFVADHSLARQVLGLSAADDVDAYIGQRLKRNGLTTLACIRELVEGRERFGDAVVAQ